MSWYVSKYCCFRFETHFIGFLDPENIFLDTVFIMEAQNVFVFFRGGGGSHVPLKNSQYFVNGDSNKKSVMNKKDGKFNFLYDICHQIQCIFNHCRFIANPKKTLKKKKEIALSH